MTIKLGWVENTFIALLVVCFTLSVLHLGGIFLALLQLVTAVFTIWVSIRVSRWAVRNAMWRLRNRLMVAYVFIALIPIVLITTLIVLGGYIAGGQLAIYLVTSELERRTNSLRGTSEFILRSKAEHEDWTRIVGNFLQSRYPGLELVATGRGPWKYPLNAKAEHPPAEWPDLSGLVIRDGHLYGWAHIQREGTHLTAVFPMTRDYLGDVGEGIGEITIRDLAVTGNRRASLLPAAPADAGAEPTKNRLPPAVGWLDREMSWLAPVTVSRWSNPAETGTVWLIVTTRPSALLRTVFPQKVDFTGEFVPLLFLSVAALFLIAELIAAIIGFSLTRNITGAIHDLYAATLRVTKGDFSHRIGSSSKDQLGALAASFDQMTANLQRLVQVEKEQERLHNELEIAREVQNQLYPKTVPNLKTLCLTAFCDPARMVSGDYYDYQIVQDNSLAIALGDVAGKGISAALLMATVQSSFRTQLRASLEMSAAAGGGLSRVSIPTAKIVTQLNQQLFAYTAPEKFATFFLGVYDEPTRTLTYTNAGHLPPILIRDSSTSRLDVNGMVVGAFAFAEYTSSVLQLEPGDLLIMFTDGITEPENPYGEDFGEERLIDLLAKNTHLDDEKLMAVVRQAVRQWSGTEEMQDDMTLLFVRSIEA
jgi:sigma-B regulation protein RsbU (phosphoserine phosphatase)